MLSCYLINQLYQDFSKILLPLIIRVVKTLVQDSKKQQLMS